MGDKVMKKLCGALVVLLLLALGAMTWFFVIRGSTAQGEDGRTVVLLSPSDRAFFLTEMRGWLESVQGISEALAEGDMKRAAEEARAAGKVDMSKIPGSLLRSIPAEMKTLGFDTHAAFRTLAKEIESGKDEKAALKMLSGLMLNCVGCHASYRVDPKRE